MTAFRIMIVVMLALTWLPVGAAMTRVWDLNARADTWANKMPKPYVFGWLFILASALYVVALAMVFAVVSTANTILGIRAFIGGGAPEYWRTIKEQASPSNETEASK